MATIRDFDFKRGDLILVRNTAIEKALNRKMRPQYIGPLIIISHNKGGAYIICELNGSVFDHPIAAFRIVPYFARRSLTLPNLDDFIDIPADRLVDMESSDVVDPEEDELDVPSDVDIDIEDDRSATDAIDSD